MNRIILVSLAIMPTILLACGCDTAPPPERQVIYVQPPQNVNPPTIVYQSPAVQQQPTIIVPQQQTPIREVREHHQDTEPRNHMPNMRRHWQDYLHCLSGKGFGFLQAVQRHRLYIRWFRQKGNLHVVHGQRGEILRSMQRHMVHKWLETLHALRWQRSNNAWALIFRE